MRVLQPSLMLDCLETDGQVDRGLVANLACQEHNVSPPWVSWSCLYILDHCPAAPKSAAWLHKVVYE